MIFLRERKKIFKIYSYTLSPKTNGIENFFFKNGLGDFIEVKRKEVEKALHMTGSQKTPEYWNAAFGSYRFKNDVRIKLNDCKDRFYIVHKAELIEQNIDELNSHIKIEHDGFIKYIKVENKENSIIAIQNFMNSIHKYFFDSINGLSIKNIKINRYKTISLCLETFGYKSFDDSALEKEIQKIIKKNNLGYIKYQILKSKSVLFYMSLDTVFTDTEENLFYEHTYVLNRKNKYLKDKRNLYYKTPVSPSTEKMLVESKEKFALEISEKALNYSYANKYCSDIWFYNEKEKCFINITARFALYENNKTTKNTLKKSIDISIDSKTTLLKEFCKSIEYINIHQYLKQENEIHNFKLKLDFSETPFSINDAQDYIVEELEKIYSQIYLGLQLNRVLANDNYRMSYHIFKDYILLSFSLNLETYARRDR